MSQHTVPLNMDELEDFDLTIPDYWDLPPTPPPVDPIVPAGGNTILPAGTTTRQISPAKAWVFTLNNYTEEEILSSIVPQFQEKATRWYFAKEVGESGTPHLQGTVEFKKKLRPLSLGLNRGIHWEKRGGTWEDSVKYCQKEDGEKYFGGFRPKRPLDRLPCEDNMFPWQQKVVDMITEKPDARTVVWIWEPVGGVGKTTFMKFLMRFHGAIPLEGKKSDILNVAAQFDSDLYLYDIERSLEQFVSYSSIEKIKNGMYMNGKYEGGIVDRNPPHVLIFANFAPDYEKLSLDRWNVFTIENNDLLPWQRFAPIFNRLN